MKVSQAALEKGAKGDARVFSSNVCRDEAQRQGLRYDVAREITEKSIWALTFGRERSMELRRPRIGITMRIELETDRFYLSRYYSEAVEAAGASPLHISLIPREGYIRALLEEVDGVLLPGSDSDVDPLRYGEEPHY